MILFWRATLTTPCCGRNCLFSAGCHWYSTCLLMHRNQSKTLSLRTVARSHQLWNASLIKLVWFRVNQTLKTVKFYLTPNTSIQAEFSQLIGWKIASTKTDCLHQIRTVCLKLSIIRHHISGQGLRCVNSLKFGKWLRTSLPKKTKTKCTGSGSFAKVSSLDALWILWTLSGKDFATMKISQWL